VQSFQDDPGIPGVVSNERVDIGSAVLSLAVVDEFDGRGNRNDSFAHLIRRERFAAYIQILAKTDVDLELKPEATKVCHR
jgi:hypothetical protein